MSAAQTVVIQGGTVVSCDGSLRAAVGDVEIVGTRLGQVGGHVVPAAGARVLDARGMIVMPGFVQTHVHLCQVLFRGHAEGRALLPWLKERIWPLEGAHSKSTLAASARLGIMELLKGGTTCALDMGTVHHTDALFETADTMGFRLVSGKALMDTASHPALQQDTDSALAQSDALATRWHNKAGGRLRYAFAPRFILSCTQRLMTQAAALARRHGALLHTHASENPAEVQAVRELLGKPNVLALSELGYTGPDVVLAHCVHIDDDEMRVLAETGTRVVHCPSTNLKLASGIAPITQMLARGVAVSIGADGAPCNNRLSMFTEMRLASLLQKPAHGADAMPAAAVLQLATLQGARALGLDADIGSLEPGKCADVMVVDTNAAHLRPRSDPFTMLVYAAEAADVRHVFVDGRWLVRDRDLVGAEDHTILDDADRALDEVMARACITRGAP